MFGIRNRTTKRTLRRSTAPALATVVLLTTAAFGQSGTDPASAKTVAYTNATIITLAKAGTIKNGTIVVSEGKIADVGKDVEIPSTARIVDASGLTILPALVELYHPISVGGSSGSTGGTRTIVINGRTFTIRNRTTTTSTAFMRIADNLDPLKIKNTLKGLSRRGIAFSNLVTSGYGQSVHARAQPADPENSIREQNGGLYVAVSNSTSSLNVIRSGLGIAGSASSSSGSAGRTRNGAPTGGRPSGGPPTSSRPPTTSSSASSGSTALWADVKAGKKPVFINVNSPATILHLLQILKKAEKAKVVLITTGANVYQTLEGLKEHKNLSVVIRPAIDRVPYSQDRVNVARMLHDAKIPFGFTTSSSSDVSAMPDTPLFPLAVLVKSGLPRDVALKAAMQVPAKLLGLEKTLGSIEKEKLANMIFVDGDPLSASSRIQKVLVEGKTAHEG